MVMTNTGSGLSAGLAGIVVILATWLAGCFDFDLEDDAGMFPPVDSGSPDAGSNDGQVLPDGSTDAGTVPLALCFPAPKGGDEAEYCVADGCEQFTTCCLSSGQCCDRSPDEEDDIDFTSCGTDPASCLAKKGLEATTGELGQLDRKRGWIPETDGSDELSLLRTEALPLDGLMLEVSAELQLPEARTGCESSCGQRLGIGLTTSAEKGAAPDVSVRLSAERRQAVLMAAQVALLTLPISSDPHEITLRVRPGGLVQLLIDGKAVQTDLRADFGEKPTRLVLFGRTEPDAEGSASIARVTIASERCTTPAFSSDRELLLEDTRVAFDHPSMAFDAAQWELLAAESSEGIGAVHLNAPDGSSGEELAVPKLTPEPDTFYAEHVGHPELAFEEGQPVMYFAARGVVGDAIGRATLDSDTLTAISVAAVLTAEEIGVERLTEPSVLEFDGQYRMAVRVRKDGKWRILLLTRTGPATSPGPQDAGIDADTMDAQVDADSCSPPGCAEDAGSCDGSSDCPAPVDAGEDAATPAPAAQIAYGLGGATLEEATVPVPSEVTDPELATVSAALLLYYTQPIELAGSEIHAVSSEDGRHWLSLGAQLSPGKELDRLGVSAPDVATDSDRVPLVYVALDEGSPQLGRATRSDR